MNGLHARLARIDDTLKNEPLTMVQAFALIEEKAALLVAIEQAGDYDKLTNVADFRRELEYQEVL